MTVDKTGVEEMVVDETGADELGINRSNLYKIITSNDSSIVYNLVFCSHLFISPC